MKKKKRKIVEEGYYFKDCPEMKLINNLVDNKKNQVHLLKNGNSSGIVSFNKQVWIVYNTCPFDTIVQSLFSSTLENPGFREFVNKSKNPTLKFLVAFLNKGPTNEINKKRLAVLYDLYKDTEVSQNKNGNSVALSRTISCQDNVNSLWSKLVAEEPSLFEYTECPNLNCNDHKTAVPVLSVNYNTIIRNGFNDLEKALDFHSFVYKIYCHSCRQKSQIPKRIPNIYLFIELDVKLINEQNGRKCKLTQLPVYLNLIVRDECDVEQNLRYRFVMSPST